MHPKKIQRDVGRRDEDFKIREQNKRYSQLCEVGKIITAEIDIKTLFPLVMSQTNKIMNAQRSTVFLYDGSTNELWSLVATGIENYEIRIPYDQGIAGWVFVNMEPLIVNNAYKDPRFNVGIDCRTGFKTENILCVPLINSSGKCIGVLQSLNKNEGFFDEPDCVFLAAISDYAAIALDNATLYESVKTYSKKLQDQIHLNESLMKLKKQLTKFVPHSVVTAVETDPDKVFIEKQLQALSVLFVDIENFSTITEKYDQRMVNHMIENYFSAYLKCIHRHGGEVNETSGDGIMVIFKGNTNVNHAFEAVSAGLEIIDENKRINDEFNYPWGDINLHLGISSGEGYLGVTKMKDPNIERWTFTVSGFVTILAARIGDLSHKSQLYICPQTYKMVCDHFECKSLGSYKLKNVSKKLSLFHVISKKKTLL